MRMTSDQYSRLKYMQRYFLFFLLFIEQSLSLYIVFPACIFIHYGLLFFSRLFYWNDYIASSCEFYHSVRGLPAVPRWCRLPQSNLAHRVTSLTSPASSRNSSVWGFGGLFLWRKTNWSKSLRLGRPAELAASRHFWSGRAGSPGPTGVHGCTTTSFLPAPTSLRRFLGHLRTRQWHIRMQSTVSNITLPGGTGQAIKYLLLLLLTWFLKDIPLWRNNDDSWGRVQSWWGYHQAAASSYGNWCCRWKVTVSGSDPSQKAEVLVVKSKPATGNAATNIIRILLL